MNIQILKGKLYATLNDTLVIYKPPTGPTQFTCIPKKTTIIALEDYDRYLRGEEEEYVQ